MKKRIYTKAERKRKTKWHKEHNKANDYSTQATHNTRYTREEMYLILNKRIQGGRILTDVEIAKFLKRSLQAIQLKRHKMLEW